jgi:hypothetical protein
MPLPAQDRAVNSFPILLKRPFAGFRLHLPSVVHFLARVEFGMGGQRQRAEK